MTDRPPAAGRIWGVIRFPLVRVILGFAGLPLAVAFTQIALLKLPSSDSVLIRKDALVSPYWRR